MEGKKNEKQRENDTWKKVLQLTIVRLWQTGHTFSYKAFLYFLALYLN